MRIKHTLCVYVNARHFTAAHNADTILQRRYLFFAASRDGAGCEGVGKYEEATAAIIILDEIIFHRRAFFWLCCETIRCALFNQFATPTPNRTLLNRPPIARLEFPLTSALKR